MEQEYLDLIDGLANEFERRIKEENEKEQLIGAFKNNLILTVSNIKVSNSRFISKDFETIRRILIKKADELCNMNVTSMKQYLLEDKNLEEIQHISARYFELAKKKVEGEHINDDIDSSKEIEKLGDLLERVNSYNKRHAQELVSEAVLDINFISKPNVNVSSLRLYHYRNSKKDKETEEER